MNKRRQAVIDFNRALWRLRVETPDSDHGLESLLIAISISVNVVLQGHDAGLTESAFMEQIEAACRDIFDKGAQA